MHMTVMRTTRCCGIFRFITSHYVLHTTHDHVSINCCRRQSNTLVILQLTENVVRWRMLTWQRMYSAILASLDSTGDHCSLCPFKEGCNKVNLRERWTCEKGKFDENHKTIQWLHRNMLTMSSMNDVYSKVLNKKSGLNEIFKSSPLNFSAYHFYTQNGIDWYRCCDTKRVYIQIEMNASNIDETYIHFTLQTTSQRILSLGII